MRPIHALSGALTLAVSLAAAAQTKWDMPTAYAATNFHTENVVQFAADVDKATGGKLKITVHAAASLFKLPEIKRAVQSGQAQIGEILISATPTRTPSSGWTRVPFLAVGVDQVRQALEELEENNRDLPNRG